MSRLIENTSSEIINHSKIISHIDETLELIINKDIYSYDYNIEYNRDSDEISVNLREKFYDIKFSKFIILESTFNTSLF